MKTSKMIEEFDEEFCVQSEHMKGYLHEVGSPIHGDDIKQFLLQSHLELIRELKKEVDNFDFIMNRDTTKEVFGQNLRCFITTKEAEIEEELNKFI